MEVISFGRYAGKSLDDPTIPDSYIEWLSGRGRYAEPGNTFEAKWKVPIVIAIAARREMERRGYKHDGYRYRKTEG